MYQAIISNRDIEFIPIFAIHQGVMYFILIIGYSLNFAGENIIFQPYFDGNQGAKLPPITLILLVISSPKIVHTSRLTPR